MTNWIWFDRAIKECVKLRDLSKDTWNPVKDSCYQIFSIFLNTRRKHLNFQWQLCLFPKPVELFAMTELKLEQCFSESSIDNIILISFFQQNVRKCFCLKTQCFNDECFNKTTFNMTKTSKAPESSQYFLNRKLLLKYCFSSRVTRP
jgi:hypothetical protein